MKTPQEVIREDFRIDFNPKEEILVSEMMITYADQFKPKWISVEEIPEEGVDLVCTDNFTCNSIGWYSCGEFVTDKEMNVTHYYYVLPELPTKP